MKSVYISSFRSSDYLCLLSDFGGYLLLSELLNIINNLSSFRKSLIYKNVKYIKVEKCT